MVLYIYIFLVLNFKKKLTAPPRGNEAYKILYSFRIKWKITHIQTRHTHLYRMKSSQTHTLTHTSPHIVYLVSSVSIYRFCLRIPPPSPWLIDLFGIVLFLKDQCGVYKGLWSRNSDVTLKCRNVGWKKILWKKNCFKNKNFHEIFFFTFF